MTYAVAAPLSRRHARETDPSIHTSTVGTGLNQESSQTEWLDLLPEGFGQTLQRKLRGTVVSIASDTHNSTQRGNVDDRSPLLETHFRQDEPDYFDGTKKVDVERCSVIGLILLLNGTPEVGTSAIYQNVDGTEVVMAGLHCRFSLACVSYIQFDNQGLISKFFGEIVHRADGSRAEHDLVTLLQDVSS
jgi:hypothetical protein